MGNSDLAQIEPSVPAAAHECILVPDWVRRRMLRRSAEGATRVTLDEIKALGLRLAELCQKYGIAELSVFGSVARGTRGRIAMLTCSTCAFQEMISACPISLCKTTWRSCSAGLLT